MRSLRRMWDPQHKWYIDKQKEIAKGKGVDKGITFSAIGDN